MALVGQMTQTSLHTESCLGCNVSMLVAQCGVNPEETKPEWNCLGHPSPACSLFIYLQGLMTQESTGWWEHQWVCEKAPVFSPWRSKSGEAFLDFLRK